MKVFECIIKDRESVYLEKLPAKNKKELMSVYGGNGEFVKVTDVTSDYPIDIDFLRQTLRNAGYGIAEQRIIINSISNENTK